MPGTKGEDGHQRIIAHITEWMIDESTQWAWSNDLPACRECRGRCGASPPANSGRAKAAFITGRRRETQAGNARVYLQAYGPGIIGHSRYGRSPLPAVAHRLQPRPAPPRTPRKLNNEHVGIPLDPMAPSSFINGIRSLAYDAAALTLSILSRFIPKDDRKILFFSVPDLSDNARYVYDKMLKSGLDKTHRLIWCVHSPVSADHVIRRSRGYIYHALTAKYIISTHGTPAWKSRNQVSIELWHGLPLKTIGCFAGINHPGTLARLSATWRLRRFTNSVDYLITTSELERLIFSSAFLIDPGKILILGQPRCDALYDPKGSGVDVLCRILSQNDIAEKRILLYLPTFREYDTNISRRILEEILENEEFHRFLKDEDLLFICKPHPHDEGAFQTYDGEHIHILLNDDLRETDTTVYDFLNAVDVLITDYSSIYFDFLHLNLPIAFHVPDIEEYRMQRGFILEPFRDWAPGDISTTIDELMASLTNALADPGRWEPERTRLQKLVFRYADGLACERVCRLIEQR